MKVFIIVLLLAFVGLAWWLVDFDEAMKSATETVATGVKQIGSEMVNDTKNGWHGR